MRARCSIHALAFVCVLVTLPSETLAADAPKRVGAFSLNDVAGKLHSRDEWSGRKAIVLFFIGTECPVSNGYCPEMQRIADQYAAKGVAAYGLHCDPDVTAELAAQHAKEYSLGFPILIDHEQVVAQAAGARVTPEAIVVTPAGDVVYRGRIDDRYSKDGKRRDEPAVHELELALDAVLAGKPIEISQTKPFGCPLPKVTRVPAAKIE